MKQISCLKSEIDILKNQLVKEKGGKVNMEKILNELINGIEEEYELKQSINELGRLQRINLEKISSKRSELLEENSNRKQKVIESDLKALEDIYNENEEIRREMQDRMCQMEGERAIWIRNAPKKAEELEKFPLTPIHLKSSLNNKTLALKETLEPRVLDFGFSTDGDVNNIEKGSLITIQNKSFLAEEKKTEKKEIFGISPNQLRLKNRIREKYKGEKSKYSLEHSDINAKLQSIKSEILSSNEKRRSSRAISKQKISTKESRKKNRGGVKQNRSWTRPTSSRDKNLDWGSIHLDNQAKRLTMLIDKLDIDFKSREKRTSKRNSRNVSRDFGNLPVNSIKISPKKKKISNQKKLVNVILKEPFQSNISSRENSEMNKRKRSGLDSKFTENGLKLVQDINLNSTDNEITKFDFDRECMLDDSMNIDFIDLAQLEDVEIEKYQKKLQKARARMREFKKKLNLMEQFLFKYEERALKKGSYEIFKAVKILIVEEKKQKYKLTADERKTMKMIYEFANKFESKWEKENADFGVIGDRSNDVDTLNGDILYRSNKRTKGFSALTRKF